jgi:hypothetical protein
MWMAQRQRMLRHHLCVPSPTGAHCLEIHDQRNPPGQPPSTSWSRRRRLSPTTSDHLCSAVLQHSLFAPARKIRADPPLVSRFRVPSVPKPSRLDFSFRTEPEVRTPKRAGAPPSRLSARSPGMSQVSFQKPTRATTAGLPPLRPRTRNRDYFWRALSLSSARFSSSSFCPASPSLPSAVRRW